MQAYPQTYTVHNLPLVLLSGLGQRDVDTPANIPRLESGTRIATASDVCTGDRASQLLDQFLRQDGSQQAWNATALPGPSAAMKYRMKAIGRTYTLPPRKAAPLPQSPSIEGMSSPQTSQLRSPELHSPLSPLSPSSPIYPDGIFTPLWVAKHQEQVPALLVAFYDLSSEESSSRNEQVQMDINATKTALSRSGFKTKLAVVLMSDQSILRAPELEDRLASVRRATAMDSKSLFFMPPMSSEVEIGTFVQNFFTSLQPFITEYYRDLTKHARRKKGRGGLSASVTSPIEASNHVLSTPSWNVRYEVKQGIFAEFRQEMDVAERHYSAAIEELFHAEGVFEATPGWSPRWDEARLLCDAVALRILRCQLWHGLTTAAAISWVNYKVRMKDLINRRGKGSQTYAWEAWEARWAEIMAQLIRKAALPALQATAKPKLEGPAELSQLQVFANPEKALAATERSPPFHFLHHPGYWLRLAIQSTIARRSVAMAIPEADRRPPSESPASAVAQRAGTYDAYLVPQPHEEYCTDERPSQYHLMETTRLTDEATREFATRGQVRATERLAFDLAYQLSSAGRYMGALERALPLWENCSWRVDDWDDLLRPLLKLVHDSAQQTGDAETHLMTAWELLAASSLPTRGNEAFAEYMDRSSPASENVVVTFRDGERLSPLSVAYAFGSAETSVGEPLECQLTVCFNTAAGTQPLTLSNLAVTLSNGKEIKIAHCGERVCLAEDHTIVHPTKSTETGMLEANLTLSPGWRSTYIFSLILREAEVVRVKQVTLQTGNVGFTLTHILTEPYLLQASCLYVSNSGGIEQEALPYGDSTSIAVLPKPPKLRLVLHGLRKQYYTDEPITLDVELINGEAEAINATAIVSVEEPGKAALTSTWTGQQVAAPQLAVGQIEPAASHKASLSIQAPAEPMASRITVNVRYTLSGETNTPLTKILTLELNFVTPFEARYSFSPLLYADAWPSFLHASSVTADEDAEGIPHRWRLRGILHFSGPESVTILGTRLILAEESEDVIIDLKDASPFDELTLEPGRSTETSFEITTRKFSFDDRRPANVELALVVQWRRDASGEAVMTSLSVPRLTLPSSEPRVLCTIADTVAPDVDMTLHFHVENPSMHFLTFAMTMEASDEFAFSGPKYRTLSAAPLSRVRAEYRLCLPQEEQIDRSATKTEDRRVSPILQVVDSYYNKSLRVHSGGPGVIVDAKGVLSVFLIPKAAAGDG
ncbi:hypothetical protein BAUCODRAFT_194601 [Baudoinia panamericana UAMH 10762]|uniref:Trafficking protein particle complex subunit 11 domain-containing protein n=1 Tax=Baudoinia panamericana (strain UAMH 10762) TaxID=717646 RepID=M2MVS4_BAUPA|nr:uncharacterized protein BAUCODRAFT_194601 [Baudoinia panamericana UAMH 10762]EMD01067.1 hypothetical protein BAUCODRAFT_194601 [Baudoinia panamericana UAMH 10762]